MTTTPSAPGSVNRVRPYLEPDPPRDPAEVARERAEELDAAVADAVRTLRDLLDSPSPSVRQSAANSLINLRKASLRHRAEVFAGAKSQTLPPLPKPGETCADGEALDEDETETEPCVNGVAGLTEEESARCAAEIGAGPWEKLCRRAAGKFTWPELRKLAEEQMAAKQTAPKPGGKIPREPGSNFPPDPTPPAPKPKPPQTYEQSPEERRETQEKIDRMNAEFAARFLRNETLASATLLSVR